MNRKFQQTVPLLASERLAPRVCRLTFACPDLAAAARPGQFVTLTMPGAALPLLRRPFSIHTAVGGRIQVLVKIVGPATRAFAAAAVGDPFDVLGPLGEGAFDPDPARPELLMVAGGIGVAPFLFLADTLPPAAFRPRLLFGGAGAADLVTVDDFAARKIDVEITTQDGSRGTPGLVTEALKQNLALRNSKITQIFACGPLPMLRAVADISINYDIPCQVSLETMMACGVGSCRGCVVPLPAPADGCAPDFVRVCAEGPVFDSRAVDLRSAL